MTLTDDMEWLLLNTKNCKTNKIKKIEGEGEEKRETEKIKYLGFPSLSFSLHVILFTVLSHVYQLGLVIISQNCLENVERWCVKKMLHTFSVYMLNCLLVCFIHSSYFLPFHSSSFIFLSIFLLFTFSSLLFFNHFIHSCYPPRLARSFPSFTSFFLSLLFSLVTYHVFRAIWKEFSVSFVSSLLTTAYLFIGIGLEYYLGVYKEELRNIYDYVVIIVIIIIRFLWSGSCIH